ncbi:MAG: TauD/TfdA family dioxygenase [Actinocatenispora sp.]
MVSGTGRFARDTRKAVVVESATVVDVVPPPEPGSPAILRTRVPGVDLTRWMSGNREAVDVALSTHGGVLFRGFDGMTDEADLQRALVDLGHRSMTYLERSTPRRTLNSAVYTSTEYPAHEEIALHCELTAAIQVPRLVWFFAVQPPETGGATPTGSTVAILRRLPTELVDRFRRYGWKLIRNYGNGYGPGWREAFQTDDPAVVEAYCDSHAVTYSWRGDLLRTVQVRRAIETHPRTGDEVWFNHVAFWHDSALADDVRAEMLRDVGVDGLPYRVTYGNDEPIDAADIALIKAAYLAERREVPWQRGDLMIIDNLLLAHGRRPFTGTRKIVVAMTDGHERAPFTPGSGDGPVVAA